MLEKAKERKSFLQNTFVSHYFLTNYIQLCQKVVFQTSKKNTLEKSHFLLTGREKVVLSFGSVFADLLLVFDKLP